MTGPILLFDGNALVHRAYHALPPLTTSTGELVNAVFGFAQMVFKATSDLKPTHWAMTFDLAAPTFRHEAFAAYKAHRPKTPDDLVQQFKRVRQLVHALHMPVYESAGFEADDLLGTLSLQAKAAGIPVVIVSGDADTLQLVDEGISVLTPGRTLAQTTIFDARAVAEKFGVRPDQLPDFKGMCGDKSDNIPGVPGIGAKTAAKLLSRFESVESIYEHIDEVEQKTRELLLKNRQSAEDSKRLATIVRSVPVQLDLPAATLTSLDRASIASLLRELEFNTLLNRIPGTPAAADAEVSRPAAPSAPVQMGLFGADPATEMAAVANDTREPIAPGKPTPSVADDLGRIPLGPYREIRDRESLQALATALAEAGRFAVDTETDSQYPVDANLVGISVSIEPGQGWYIPVGHLKDGARDAGQVTPAEAAYALRPLLESPEIAKYAHNGKFEIEIFAKYGIQMSGLAFDTMIAGYLLDASLRSFSLSNLMWRYLGKELTPIADLIGKGKTPRRTMAEVPIDDVAQYAGAHADATLRLTTLLGPRLEQEGLKSLFENVELRLVPILAEMESTGVKVDKQVLADLSSALGARLAEVESTIYEACGSRFNINSTQQLGGMLFDVLGLPRLKKTRTGYSTDAEVLEELKDKHPVVQSVLEYRQLQKLKSTYIDALPNLINARTGRVHTSFNQTGTVTGRLSSSEPNLQNIPIRTELGRQIRRAFSAPDDSTRLLAADYSQIDLRVMAHYSLDQKLVEAFLAGQDIHAATAAVVFHVGLDSVTPEMRRLAKTVNFGVIYGISDYGLSSRSTLSMEEANRFINGYFSQYPGIAEFMERTKREAASHGYVSTLLGRKRYLPEITSSNRILRQAAERMAINMPIQGTSADIVKLAMIRVADALKHGGYKTRMILQVHDELVFEVPLTEMDDMRGLLKTNMESAMELVVPLKVDFKVGDNWGDIELTSDDLGAEAPENA